MWLFLLLLASLGFAEIDVRNLKDKTFTRDNTFCTIGKKRLQIQIRGVSSHTEVGEGKYGDWIFFYPEENQPQVLPLNSNQLSKYRLFEGTSQKSVCTKSYGFLLDNDKIAILFLEENRPFLDKLSLQMFDAKTSGPMEVVDTGLMTDAAEAIKGGFIFRSYIEKGEAINGSFEKDGAEFAYNNMDFPYWLKYTRNGSEIDPNVSFEKCSLKKHFKDKNDFLKATGWDPQTKKFGHLIVYRAYSHQLSRECILIRLEKSSITGTEADWRCL